ncbi:ABC transporter substrate-binding protein [Mycetocola reblochoni]|uniref:ABC transporter (Iron.B12.siderophore.hemin), periplasmic substrate-binding component n=2 Tax=Mycetocola reblochoni TaxID=331618 RepID=A0A1R4JJV1_9MICO|nr:ABC transporter substrate-binding protein [Mycetocola reblochoni]SJN32204.1 ABC transporter (iron.B12.siderophore.hemin), periplasmic substrate-binding component [Mycetocola reblochoni REB411]
MPLPSRRIVAAGAIMVSLALAGCSSTTDTTAHSPGASPSNAGYPVTIDNCDRETTFDAAPDRVVSLWQSATEMLLALGLGDRIVATAGDYAPYPESIADDAAALNSIGSAMGWPSKEVVLSQDPDLVIGQSLEGFAFDASYGYATAEELEDAGIDLYGANMCVPEDSLSMTVDTSSETLADLGRIFGVEDEAEALIAKIAAQKQAVVDAVSGLDAPSVVYYQGGEGPIHVLAGGIYTSAIETAGGTSAFPTEADVSREDFAASDAEVLLVATFEGQDFASRLAYLEETFPDLPAVKNGRVYELPVADTDASISVMRGLTEIANAIHGLDLPVPSS